MLIHIYTTVAPGYENNTPRETHIGHGLGSLFGRLFSRIGSSVAKSSIKTALKTVAKTGAKIGQKALSSAVKKAAPLAKEALKEGITSATNFGAEKAIQGIQNLADKSIKHGAPTSLAHSLAKAAEKGTKSVAKATHSALSNSVDNLLLPTTPPTRKRKKSHPSPKKQSKKRRSTGISNLLNKI